MSRRQRLVTVAVIAAVLALAGYLGWDLLFERVEEEVDRGFRGEAAVNPVYALEKLLTELGVPARSVSSLRRLPPTDHALVLAARRRSFGPAGAERLLAWAEEGGHLVVVPAGDYQPWENDPVLVALGIGRFREEQEEVESRSALASERPPWPLLYADGKRQVLRADGADDAAWLLSVRVGRGAATVVSDGAFWTNDAIGLKDHALIAWKALVLERPPAGAWLVFRDPKPSVWVLLTARARPAALTLAVLAVAGLLAFSRRFGPLLEAAARDRRQLAEHVRATARFLWRVGSENVLLAAERRELGRRLGHGLEPAEERLETLARAAAAVAGLDPEEVSTALATRETRDRQDFTRTVHTLETLRRSK